MDLITLYEHYDYCQNEGVCPMCGNPVDWVRKLDYCAIGYDVFLLNCCGITYVLFDSKHETLEVTNKLELPPSW